MKRLVQAALFLFGVVVFHSPVFATNFLTNADFESASLTPWTSSGGSAQATISSELAHGGAYAIKIQHDKTSSYGFQQTILNLEGGMFFEISGYGATKDVNIAGYLLRVAWYASNDGSGTQLSSPNDTDKADRMNGEWVRFSQIIQAPVDAHSAKVRLVLTSKTNGTLAWVYFDDISFQESVAPTPTPTFTPAPTPTNTPQPAVTPTPTNVPTPTKTPTPTPKKTPTPTIPSPIEATLSSLFLGSEDTGEVLGSSQSAASHPVETIQRRPLLPLAISLLLMSIGLGMLSLVFIWKKRGG